MTPRAATAVAGSCDDGAPVLHPSTAEATSGSCKSYEWPLQKLPPASLTGYDRRLGKLQPLHAEATTGARRSCNRRGADCDGGLESYNRRWESCIRRLQKLYPAARNAGTGGTACYNRQGSVLRRQRFFAGSLCKFCWNRHLFLLEPERFFATTSGQRLIFCWIQ